MPRSRRRRLTKRAFSDVAATAGPGSLEVAAGDNGTARLRRSTALQAIRVDVAGALAGDRELSPADDERIRRHRSHRGELFYSDLLYAVCHHHFASEVAETTWQQILAHKDDVTRRLGRNPGVVAAALDYLTNVSGALTAVSLIAESDFAELAGLALRDGMTGLFNHSACYELLDLELSNHRRYGLGVSLLLLDIDDFKSFNELGGHRAGDAVLVDLARVLVEETRESDICCRLGGDEFVVILRPVGDPIEAARLAERIRARAAGIVAHGRQLAISVGVAAYDDPAISPHAFVDQADRALRRAKAEGKDRVAAC